MIQQVSRVLAQTEAFHQQTNVATEQQFANVLAEKTKALDVTDVEAAVEDIASRYDVRSMTFEQLTDMANELHDAGAMTFQEMMMMTFDYGRATDYIKQAANGNAAPNFTMYETAADDAGRIDWIAEFTARAAKDQKYGNLIGQSNKMNIVQLLQSLQR
ncbi:MAG: hypothetical protein UHX00_05565 [Caryophanon sp.]|nr:hypothetical protein [Caryophanon sp.]